MSTESNNISPFRTIQSAINESTGEIIYASSLDNEIFAKNLRKVIDSQKEKLLCPCCFDNLRVSVNRKNKYTPTYFFGHLKNHSDCLLIDRYLSEDEITLFNETITAKESARHKSLKNLIAKKLKDEKLVQENSIEVEKSIIQGGKLVRRPDVFCVINNKKMAFEIQTSKLSHKFLIKRSEFYKKEGYYNIWLIDQFTPSKKKQFFIDTALLNDYENIFKVIDDPNGTLKFKCFYKEYYLKDNLEISKRLQSKTVALEDLNFDDRFQVFYYNPKSALKQVKLEKQRLEDKKKHDQKIRRKKIEKQKREEEYKNYKEWADEWIKAFNPDKTYKVVIYENPYYWFFNGKRKILLINFKISVKALENLLTEVSIKRKDILLIKSSISFKKSDKISLVKFNLGIFDEEELGNNFDSWSSHLYHEKVDLSEKIRDLKSYISIDQTEQQKIKSKLDNIKKLTDRIIDHIQRKDSDFDNIELYNSIENELKGKLVTIKKESLRLKTKKEKIIRTIELIKKTDDYIFENQVFKTLPIVPSLNEVQKYINDYALIKKGQAELFTKRADISEIKNAYNYDRTKDYLFLLRPERKLDDLNSSLELIIEELAKFSKLQKELHDIIKKNIEDKLASDLSDKENQMRERRDDIKGLKKIRKEISEKRDDFYQRRKGISIKFKGLYKFKDGIISSKFKNLRPHILIDNMYYRSEIFYLKEENDNIFKKIEPKEFIEGI